MVDGWTAVKRSRIKFSLGVKCRIFFIVKLSCRSLVWILSMIWYSCVDGIWFIFMWMAMRDASMLFDDLMGIAISAYWFIVSLRMLRRYVSLRFCVFQMMIIEIITIVGIG